MTSDENRAALGFSFLQTRSRRTLSRTSTSTAQERLIRNEAASVLTTAADNISKSWGAFTASDVAVLNSQALNKQRRQLMLAATAAKLDAFTKVKEVIDKMVANIKQQMADDVKNKDQCGVDIRDNEQATRDAKRLKQLTESNIENLQDNIEELKEQIGQAGQAITDQKSAIKKASQEREEENKNFQTDLQAQRDMGGVLTKAFTVLKTHFDKSAKSSDASLVQVAHKQPTDLPGEFTPYKANAGKNAVLAMFEKIIADTKSSETELLKEESESQSSYESFVADSNAQIESLASEIASMGEDKAAKGKELSNEKTTLGDTDKEIENLGQMNGALHGSCDFLLKYFDVRQEAMSSEIAACQKAKAILSGSK
jgi:chromosome segregation ATPase